MFYSLKKGLNLISRRSLNIFLIQVIFVLLSIQFRDEVIHGIVSIFPYQEWTAINALQGKTPWYMFYDAAKFSMIIGYLLIPLFMAIFWLFRIIIFTLKLFDIK
jgi:hypothetical protein